MSGKNQPGFDWLTKQKETLAKNFFFVLETQNTDSVKFRVSL